MAKDNKTDLPNTRPSAPRKSQKSLSRWTVVSILLSIGAVAAAGYGLYRFEFILAPDISVVVEQSEISTRKIDAVNASNQQSGALIANLQSQIQALNSSSDLHSSQLQDVVASLSAFKSERDRSVERWKVEEILQILSIGNHRLQFASDYDTAVVTRKIADEQLGRLEDPRHVIVRKALNEEIAILEQSERNDTTAIALRLLGMAEAVDDLPLQVEQVVGKSNSSEENVENQTENSSGQNIAFRIWNQVLQDLRLLVRVRNTDDHITPAFSQQQQYYAVENLRIKLHSSRLAVLQWRAEIYQANLDSAIAWVRLYFAESDPSVIRFIENLSELAILSVETEIPDVSESIVLLRVIASSR